VIPNDPYRITRALEIALAERADGTPAAIAPGEPAVAAPSLRAREIPHRKLVVTVAPDVLAQRIAARVDAMLAAGFVEEAERIGEDAVAANAVGYREALAYLRGWSTQGELRELLARNTRRYAKRQATWFRTEPGLIPVPTGDLDAATNALAGLPGW
jgi:tRNA dimethylallyltransferase